MASLTRAIRAWRDAIGPGNVLVDGETIRRAETATFRTTGRVVAVIRPGSRAEVQACVRVAARERVPVYPVSCGKNWGYGSRVPPGEPCAVMELARMNRIVDFSEELGYATVEPGVTFRQLYDHLRRRRSKLAMSVTGSTPDSSLLGNALERGLGSGPYGDRFAHACALEVVLGTGECIHTGFERFAGARAARVYRWGVGPHVDGLFAQSNLGIVTRMTIWLPRAPRFQETFVLGLASTARLRGFLDALREAKATGAVRQSVALYRAEFEVATVRQYPWREAGGRTPLPARVLREVRALLGGSLWLGFGTLCCASRDQLAAERRLVERALGSRVDRLAFQDAPERWLEPRSAAAARWPARPAREDLVVALLRRRWPLGVPDFRSPASAYWRKKAPPPKDPDLDRDRCGLLWMAPVVPFSGRHAVAAARILETTATAHGFEPLVEVHAIGGMSLHVVTSIRFDRDARGDDARALACHDEMLRRLAREGYLPYRLSIRGMRALPAPIDDSDGFLRRLKSALDPARVIAPGRYEPPEA